MRKNSRPIMIYHRFASWLIIEKNPYPPKTREREKRDYRSNDASKFYRTTKKGFLKHNQRENLKNPQIPEKKNLSTLNQWNEHIKP